MSDVDDAISKINKASHGSGREAIDGIFAGFKELMRLDHEAFLANKERKRVRRNDRARKRYALRKQLGIPTRKPKPVPESVYESYEEPTSCYCSTCRMPPCGWCESGAGGDEE